MENGYNGGIDTNSLLLARGVGGYGYGGFGGGGSGYGGGILTAEAMANGTATKEAIDCGIRQFDSGLNRVSDQAEEGRRSAQFTSLIDKSGNDTNRVTDNQFRAELRGSDQHAAIVSEMNANARISAQCCCDTQKAISDAAAAAALCCCDAKLEACKSHADLKAEIIAQNSLTREQIRGDALGAANAELTSLKTQIACGCCCPTP
jgi:hypothetical protein